LVDNIIESGSVTVATGKLFFGMMMIMMMIMMLMRVIIFLDIYLQIMDMPCIKVRENARIR